MPWLIWALLGGVGLAFLAGGSTTASPGKTSPAQKPPVMSSRKQDFISAVLAVLSQDISYARSQIGIANPTDRHVLAQEAMMTVTWDQLVESLARINNLQALVFYPDVMTYAIGAYWDAKAVVAPGPGSLGARMEDPDVLTNDCAVRISRYLHDAVLKSAQAASAPVMAPAPAERQVSRARPPSAPVMEPMTAPAESTQPNPAYPALQELISKTTSDAGVWNNIITNESGDSDFVASALWTVSDPALKKYMMAKIRRNTATIAAAHGLSSKVTTSGDILAAIFGSNEDMVSSDFNLERISKSEETGENAPLAQQISGFEDEELENEEDDIDDEEEEEEDPWSSPPPISEE
jgi:hypothetical protein